MCLPPEPLEVAESREERPPGSSSLRSMLGSPGSLLCSRGHSRVKVPACRREGMGGHRVAPKTHSVPRAWQPRPSLGVKDTDCGGLGVGWGSSCHRPDGPSRAVCLLGASCLPLEDAPSFTNMGEEMWRLNSQQVTGKFHPHQRFAGGFPSNREKPKRP